jgi:ligand-binding sensor domain-containing protein
MQDRNENLWIGSDIGITVFEKNNTTPVFYRHTSENNSLATDNVISLLQDSKGRIWVGTAEGLNLFNEQTESFQAFTTSNGLPDNIILNILEDNHQTLWISTPNGLCNAFRRKKKITSVCLLLTTMKQIVFKTGIQ